MNKTIIKNGNVFYQGKIQALDILLEDEYITKIDTTIEDKEATILDASNQLVTLGFVDIHTHLREPGFEYKETIATGTKSAKYGGYTHIVAMANTLPCMDTIETIRDFEQRVKKDAVVHTYTYSAITKGLAGKELVDFKTNNSSPLVVGFSDDGRGVQAKEMMKKAMIEAKKENSIIVAHCEDESELHGGCIHDGKYARAHGLVGINNDSEWKQALRDLQLEQEIQGRYHICHISTKETVAALKEFRNKGLTVSGEACPHHLILTDENIKDCHPNYKMNPPLRSVEDLEALLQGIREGVVTVISTDHAPHSEEEKQRPIDKAPFGIIGNQHAFSLMNTYIIEKGLLSLETVLTCMSDNPAKVIGLDHQLEVNKKANLCIIDLEKEFTITKENIQSKATNTPFLGVTCKGMVTHHILDGVVTKL